MSGPKRGVLLLGVTLLLAAGSLAAQSWRGAAGLEIRVSSRKQGPVANAVVELKYRGEPGEVGPPPVATDAKGRALVVGLANGTWQVEVQHPDFMSFVAVVQLDSRGKPQITASFLQAAVSRSTPIQVKLLKAKGGTPSPPLPLARHPQPPVVEPVSPPEPAPVPKPEPAAPRPKIEETPQPAQPAVMEPAPKPEPRPIPPPIEPETIPEPPAPQPEPEALAAPSVIEPEPVVAAPELPIPAPPAAEVPAEKAQVEGVSAEPVVLPTPTPAPVPAEDAPLLPTPAPVPAEEPQILPTPAPIPEVEPQPEQAPESPRLLIRPPTPPTRPIAEPEWRSYRHHTCPECRPGEWAVSVATTLAGDGTCSAEVRDGVADALAVLGGRGALELAAFAGGLDAATEVAGASAERVGTAVANAAASGCRVLAVVLPKSARFVGFQFEFVGAEGRRPCLPDQPCPGGTASFSGPPKIARGAAATVVHAVAHGSGGEALMTVFFKAPNSNWNPASR